MLPVSIVRSDLVLLLNLGLVVFGFDLDVWVGLLCGRAPYVLFTPLDSITSSSCRLPSDQTTPVPVCQAPLSVCSPWPFSGLPLTSDGFWASKDRRNSRKGRKAASSNLLSPKLDFDGCPGFAALDRSPGVGGGVGPSDCIVWNLPNGAQSSERIPGRSAPAVRPCPSCPGDRPL